MSVPFADIGDRSSAVPFGGNPELIKHVAGEPLASNAEAVIVNDHQEEQAQFFVTMRSRFYDCTRLILGTEALLSEVQAELGKALSGYQRRLLGFHRAVASGKTREIARALHAIAISSAAKLVVYVLANWKSSGGLTLIDLQSKAGRTNIYRPSDEPVWATPRGKSSGGKRWTCDFGPRARAAQRMIEHIVFVGVGNSAFEYARKGRGREAAAGAGLRAIRHKGVRWFGVADVKSFFPSISREIVYAAFWFLPQRVIDAVIFIHEDTDIRVKRLYETNQTKGSVSAIRAGIPQGSLASLIVASKVLEPHLAALKAPLAAVHVDNLLLGGRTEIETRAMLIALADALRQQPGGSLLLTTDVFEIGDRDMDYLGICFRQQSRTFGGYGRVMPSTRSVIKSHTRLAYRLLLGVRDWETRIDQHCDQWVRSFPSWKSSLSRQEMATIHFQSDIEMEVFYARRQLCCKASWQTWADMREDLTDFARVLGNISPRMFTENH